MRRSPCALSLTFRKEILALLRDSLFAMKSRAIVAALGFVMAAAAATAQPSTVFPPATRDGMALRLPQSVFVFYGNTPFDRGNILEHRRGPPRFFPLTQRLLSIGALNIRLGGAGAGTHFSSYDFGEKRFLGGRISGTLDGRQGTIRLVWPTGE